MNMVNTMPHQEEPDKMGFVPPPILDQMMMLQFIQQ
jgi:hypothetical protein